MPKRQAWQRVHLPKRTTKTTGKQAGGKEHRNDNITHSFEGTKERIEYGLRAK